MNQEQGKSKLIAALLGIFLGPFGAHNFYLGYTTKAVIQLCITFLTCGIGAIVTFIWGIIEGIMILTGSISVDAKGIPLVDGANVRITQPITNMTNQNYQNDFKILIKSKKNEDNSTVIIGDVLSGSISVGDNVRIENMETREFITSKVLSIQEEGMNVSFSMDKNITIRIEKIDITNISDTLIK